MDDAVALVEAYLRVNGFFTVTEFPVLRRLADGSFAETTDLDVLACRMPEAGRVLPAPGRNQGPKMATDDKLAIRWGHAEFLIGEVKEGTATMNSAMFQPQVLYEAVRRFGIAPRAELSKIVDDLGERGVAFRSNGDRVRLVAFGSRPPDRRQKTPYLFVSIPSVVSFLRAYLQAHWRVQAKSGFRDPVLHFLSVLEKAGALRQDHRPQHR